MYKVRRVFLSIFILYEGENMKTKMLVVAMFVSLFVLTSFASADEVSKVQIQRTTTIHYELSEGIQPYDRQQLLKYSIMNMLEKRNVHGVVVSVEEKSVTLLVKGNLNLQVHNFCVFQSIQDVLGKKSILE